MQGYVFESFNFLAKKKNQPIWVPYSALPARLLLAASGGQPLLLSVPQKQMQHSDSQIWKRSQEL